jgi:hypothetical protein
MRVAIPLLPWAISVGLERRSRQPLRWRLRLRTLLILVAIAALLMGGWVARERHVVWKEREQRYRQNAEMFGRREASNLMYAASGKMGEGEVGDEKGWRVIRLGPDEFKRLAAYYGRMKRKYEQAASTPWLAVEWDFGTSESSRIADEQGAVPTAAPQSWLGVPSSLSKAAMNSGQ